MFVDKVNMDEMACLNPGEFCAECDMKEECVLFIKMGEIQPDEEDIMVGYAS